MLVQLTPEVLHTLCISRKQATERDSVGPMLATLALAAIRT